EGATVVPASRHAVDGITLDAQDSASVTAALEQWRARNRTVTGRVTAGLGYRPVWVYPEPTIDRARPGLN
ncbi:MAG TPA: hypothetical protein VLJ88_09590, partial [Propionibacteriaceae bacterium]|nr:hypothetical protein [Propionibacteriaceae bacterium]